MAVVGHLAAAGRAADDVLPVERRQGEYAQRRRRADDAPPGRRKPDRFTYDPMNPVPSHGGNVCCTGNAVAGGAFDQRKMEERPDILVYSTEPLKEGHRVSGPIEATLYVSSDAKDTDFTVKVARRVPGRPGLQPGRDDSADAVSERLRQAPGLDGSRQGLQGRRCSR